MATKGTDMTKADKPLRILTREEILAADDRPIKSVEVPEWGATVLLRAMTARDRTLLEQELTTGRGADRDINLDNAAVRILARCIVDAEGHTIFGPDDIAALGAKGSRPIQRLFEVAVRLCGLSASDVGELTEPSE